MIGRNNDQMQIDMFKTTLFEQLNDKHPLHRLAHTFPWQIVEKEFALLAHGTTCSSHQAHDWTHHTATNQEA